MRTTEAWLRLMRLGNAPTALSSIAGAWALYGGESSEVACVGLAIVAAYVGGMLLNDVFDLSFDQKHHPQRPLPQKLVPRSQVILAAIFCGILCLGLAWNLAQTSKGCLLLMIYRIVPENRC